MNNERKQLRDNYLWKSERGGSFMKTITKAISIADQENLGKLYKGFPELVDGYLLYTRDKTFEELYANK